MKKLSLVLAALFVISTAGATLHAKCYTFRDGKGYKACVKGDSFSARKKAKKLCKQKKGSSCGSVASSSSSCHSNSGKCIDHNGKLDRSLRGY